MGGAGSGAAGSSGFAAAVAAALGPLGTSAGLGLGGAEEQPLIANLDAIVDEYLRKRGYAATARALRAEAGASQGGGRVRSAGQLARDTAAGEGGAPAPPEGAHGVWLCEAEARNIPSTYGTCYGQVAEWALGSSLEDARLELAALLYPVFVHCYLELLGRDFSAAAAAFLERHRGPLLPEHGPEIHQLSFVTRASQLHTDERCALWLRSRYRVNLSAQTFRLLVRFLQATENICVLAIVNQHLSVRVFPSSPRSLQHYELVTGLLDPAADDRPSVMAVNLTRPPRLHWGLLHDDLEYLAQIEQLSADEAKQRLFASDDSKLPAAFLLPSLSSSTTTTTTTTAVKGSSSSTTSSSSPSPDKMLPLPSLSAEARAQHLSDIRARVAVSAAALPSVAMFTFCNTSEGVTSIAISEDASIVAAGFGDSAIRIWNFKQQYENHKSGPPSSSSSFSFSSSIPAPASLSTSSLAPADQPVAAAPSMPNLSFQANGSPAVPLPTPLPPSVEPSATPATTAGKTAAGTTAAMPTNSTEAYTTLIGHSGPVYSVSFSPDNRFLISASQDSTIRLWSVKTGANLVCYKSHNFAVWTVQFSPLGYYFASGSHDRTARLWATNQIYPLRIFVGHLSDVDCVQFHPNCTYMATGSSDKTVRLWEIHTGECMRIFSGHLGGISALAFSPDGRVLASSSSDKTIHLWDLVEGTSLSHLFGHRKSIWSLAFSREGSVLASGSADRTVRLWNFKKAIAESEPASSISKAASRKRKLAICPYLLESFPTKATPVHFVQFTRRNLLVAAGAFQSK